MSELRHTWAHFEHFRAVFRRMGLPMALDTGGLALFGLESTAEGPDPKSEFHRALTALGVSHLVAPSPQAKGKIERRFGTLPGRVVTFLGHEKVPSFAHAQVVLQDEIDPLSRTVCRTAGMSPHDRWDKASQDGQTVMRPVPITALLDLHLALHDRCRRNTDNPAAWGPWKVLPLNQSHVAPAMSRILNTRRHDRNPALRQRTDGCHPRPPCGIHAGEACRLFRTGFARRGLSIMSDHQKPSMRPKRRGKIVLKLGPFGLLLTRGIVLSVLGMAFCLGLVGVSLLKVWRVTPDGFVPVIRISWLDMVQARMLASSAREHLAAGRLRESSHAWRGAIANHPTAVPLLREWVQAAVTADEKFLQDGGAPLNQSVMLLHLGGTNITDVELVIRLMWRLNRPAEALQLGVPLEDKLSPLGAGFVARGLFDFGEMAAFDGVWKRHEADFAKDGELLLYRAAWAAHWGPSAGAKDARERLTAAQSDPARRILALELARRVAAARSDLDEHERLMGMLLQEKAATFRAHAERWLLLAGNGRREDAQRLAKAAAGSLEGRNAAETRVIVEALVRIDLAKDALALLKRRPPVQMRDVPLWMLQGKILEAMGEWDDLSAVALSLRSMPGTSWLEELSYSMEALAKAKQTRPDMAQMAAKRASEAPPGDPSAALQASAWLMDAGMPGAGLAVLRKAEPNLKGSLVYWGRRVMAASLVPDADDMLRSSEQCRLMAPDNPVVANNHAATLVVTGRKPAEAVQLTFANLSKFPNSPDFQINHAIALLMNDRVEEAGKLLQSVDADRLTAAQRANFHLAWLEVAVRVHKWADARERGLLIDRTQLMPLQLTKLEQLNRQVGRAN